MKRYCGRHGEQGRGALLHGTGVGAPRSNPTLANVQGAFRDESNGLYGRCKRDYFLFAGE